MKASAVMEHRTRTTAGITDESALSPPDLLCSEPALRLDASSLRQSVTFAFASGAAGGAFDRVLAHARLPASTWEPSDFAAQLFLPEFIASCLDVTLDGRRYPLNQTLLARALARPPSDASTVEMRREVFRELEASEATRTDFKRAYASLCRFRAHLETTPMLRGANVSRRRLEILGALKSAVDSLADAFPLARSALARVRTFGDLLRAGSAYRGLADLLNYDENLATVDLRMRVGADGRVRALELVAARENEKNAFYTSPFGRFVSRLLLTFRGIRFSDDEILARAVESVFEKFEGPVVALFQLLGDMEFYLAGLALRERAATRGLAVCLPELVDLPSHGADTREARRLFNPLLLTAEAKVVPCDIVVDRFDATSILTGPNSGGKTRLLQSLALAQLLGQTGFFVPAASARLLRAPSLFVSIVEQARADQSEGRLGTELLRVRALFERLRPGGMVVVDELCSGTNPSEGEEIFELVVSLLAELHPQAFITTHFLQLALRMEREPPAPRLAFLQVQLDPREHPTYQFVPGVARTSLAHQTAERLGVTRSELLALVRKARGEDEPRHS